MEKYLRREFEKNGRRNGWLQLGQLISMPRKSVRDTAATQCQAIQFECTAGKPQMGSLDCGTTLLVKQGWTLRSFPDRKGSPLRCH